MRIQRGGGRGSGPPPENHKLYIFYRNKQLEPPTPEYGHAAYQIEGTYACSNMVASIIPKDTPRLRGVSTDKTFFSEINHVEDQNGVYSTLKVQNVKDHPHKIKLKGGKYRLTLRWPITWSD